MKEDERCGKKGTSKVTQYVKREQAMQKGNKYVLMTQVGKEGYIITKYVSMILRR